MSKKLNLDEAAEMIDTFNELTTSELLNGILLNIGKVRFTDQDLYRFLKTVDLDDRFGIRQGDAGLHGESIDITIAFSKMALALEDWGDHYEVNNSMRASLRKVLIERGVLPKYEKFFQKLAKQFIASLKK